MFYVSILYKRMNIDLSKINFLSTIYLILLVPFLFFSFREQQISTPNSIQLSAIIPAILVSIWIISAFITAIIRIYPEQHPIANQKNSINDLFFRNIATTALQLMIVFDALIVLNHITPLSHNPLLTSAVYITVAVVIVPISYDLTYLKRSIPKPVQLIFVALQIALAMFLTHQALANPAIRLEQYAVMHVGIISIMSYGFYMVAKQLHHFTPPAPRMTLYGYFALAQFLIVAFSFGSSALISLYIIKQTEIPLFMLGGLLVLFGGMSGFTLILNAVILKPFVRYLSKIESQHELFIALQQENYKDLPHLIKKYRATNYNYDDAYNIAYAYFLLGDADSAIAFIETTAKLLFEATPPQSMTDDFFTSHFQSTLGSFYAENDDLISGRKYLEKALAHTHVSSMALLSTAILDTRQNRFDDAEILLQRYIKNLTENPDIMRYWAVLAWLEQKKGHAVTADEYLKTAHDKITYPLDARFYQIYNGMVQQERGEIQQAKRKFEQLLTTPTGTHYHKLGRKLLDQLSELT